MACFRSRCPVLFLVLHLVAGNSFQVDKRSVLGVDSDAVQALYSPLSSPQQINSTKHINLGMDQAYLNLTSVDKTSVHAFYNVYGVSENCYKCPIQRLARVSYDKGSQGFIIDTRWPFRLFVNTSYDPLPNCSITFHFGESGHYTYEYKFNVASGQELTCAMVVSVEPENSNIPILVAAAILFALVLIVMFIKWIRRTYLKSFNPTMYTNSNLASSVLKDLGRDSQTQGSGTVTQV